MDITAVILAKNEEKNIADCIKCVSFCNEILVIDDNSSDNTVQIAKKLGARIIIHSLENNFALQRNFALSKAKNEWVLFIDADERINKKLQEEIKSEVNQNSNFNGFYIRRYDFMWGKFLKHGETGDMYFLRLAKKTAGTWVGKVHESWIGSGQTGELKNPLFHYPHVNTKEFLREINFYSTLRAEELFEKGEKTSLSQITFYPTGKFAQNYFLKMGFMDAVPGLLFALMMSFHSFLVRAKLWQLRDSRSK